MDDNVNIKKTMTEIAYYSNAIEDNEDDNNYGRIDIMEKDKNRENIICVELINNNKIYIKFDDNWTIEKVYISSLSLLKALSYIRNLKSYILTSLGNWTLSSLILYLICT
jgi:hypothetical protein